MCVGIMKPEDNSPRVGSFLQDLPGWWQASILPEPSSQFCVFFLSLVNVSQFYLKRSSWLQNIPIASLQLSNLLKTSIPFPVLWVKSISQGFHLLHCSESHSAPDTNEKPWHIWGLELHIILDLMNWNVSALLETLFVFDVCLRSYYIFSLVNYSIQTPVLGWGW